MEPGSDGNGEGDSKRLRGRRFTCVIILSQGEANRDTVECRPGV